MRSFLLIAVLIVLSSCSSAKVRARTLYVGRDSLASHIRDTPDPEKASTAIKQVVWIQWSVPQHYDNLQLDAILRFTDGSDRQEQFPVQGPFGTISIESSQAERNEKGPIVSYQIFLKNNGLIIATTRHKLWVEKVHVDDG